MASVYIAGRLAPTNVALLEASRALGEDAHLLPPDVLCRRVAPGDVVVGRLDVLPTLDGIEPGLDFLQRLEAVGFVVLNCAASLLAAHDKWTTARRLAAVGVAHPRTAHVYAARDSVDLEPPVVVKPRFGSWGRDVIRCDTRRALARTLDRASRRPWFQRHGAIVQELVPPQGRDLRLIVAGGTVVGAVERRAARGEWRTNVALGGTRRPIVPTADVCSLAVAAAAALGADLVGVDILPVENGFTVLELNGCVDFCDDYAFAGEDVFAEAMGRLLPWCTPWPLDEPDEIPWRPFSMQPVFPGGPAGDRAQ